MEKPPEQPFDLAAELARQPHLLEIPGDLLMTSGPKDYIGAILCLRGTLYFEEAHTPRSARRCANASTTSGGWPNPISPGSGARSRQRASR